jgi:hypothetical protein
MHRSALGFMPGTLRSFARDFDAVQRVEYRDALGQKEGDCRSDLCHGADNPSVARVNDNEAAASYGKRAKPSKKERSP